MSPCINKTSRSKTFGNSREEPEAFRRIHQHAQVFRSKAMAQRRKTLTSTSSAPTGWLQMPLNQSGCKSRDSRHGECEDYVVRQPRTITSCSHDCAAYPKCFGLGGLKLYKNLRRTLWNHLQCYQQLWSVRSTALCSIS